MDEAETQGWEMAPQSSCDSWPGLGPSVAGGRWLWPLEKVGEGSIERNRVSLEKEGWGLWSPHPPPHPGWNVCQQEDQIGRWTRGEGDHTGPCGEQPPKARSWLRFFSGIAREEGRNQFSATKNQMDAIATSLLAN